MADDDQESASNSQASPNGKRIPKKKHYPFGTPSHKVPYSQYNHLKVTDVLLFQEISMSENIKAEIRSGNEEKEKEKSKRGPVKVDDDFLKYAQPTKPEDGTELCKRIDCRNLLRKILESMSTLQVERDNIHIEIELLGNEYVAAEQENAQSEEKLKMITRENDQLEATLEHLNAQVSKLETKKSDLQQERDEFGNKMMVTETEKQNWIRQVQQAHKGLADAMWRGERQEIQTTHTDIVIKKRDPNCAKYDRAVSTAYSRLASGGVLDYSERPPPMSTSSIPLFLKSELLPGSPGLDDSNDLRSLNSGSMRSTASGRLKPLTMSDEAKLRRRIGKLQKDNSPFVSTHANAYRGYTPSGAPVNRANSSHHQTASAEALKMSNSMILHSMKKALSRSMPSLDRHRAPVGSSVRGMGLGELSFSSEAANSDFSNNPDHTWAKLDPVFFNAKAAESFSRSDRVGKQRSIRNQQEFTRLLTYQHPGLNGAKTGESF